ncbi:MAG: hypothetical protein M1419_04105 [Bacteroidetes bacterium]|nr:hypothetical protein [Bacteroidota bacterium]
MKFSEHYINDVKPKRPYLTVEILEEIIMNPIKTEIQDDKRIKLWGFSSKYNKYIRIVLLVDGETIHTAFFDRNFKI